MARPVGLCTEIDPQALGPGQYAQFANLTLAGAAVNPVPGDGTHATATWEEQQLGTNIVSEPFSVEGTQGFLAYVNRDGGAAQWRTPAGSVSPLAYPMPGTPTISVTPRDGVTVSGTGIGRGEEVTVAGAWARDGMMVSSLGTPLTRTQNYEKVGITVAGIAVPTPEVSVITGSGGAATYAGLVNTGVGFYNFAIYGRTGTFGSGDVVSWGTGTGQQGTLTGTVSDLDRANFVYTRPDLPSPAPTGWELYILAASGSYYRTGTQTVGSTITISENSSLYTTDASAIYDGPLDSSGLPATLVVPGTAQTLALHKGCLFIGEGHLIRWSEGAITGKEYRWFREGFTIDAGATVWALVSRGEHLEVWTPRGVRYIVGGPPYFEIRDTQMGEPPMDRYSITPTAAGTFYRARDGLRRFTEAAGRDVSQGVNGPWFDSVTSTVGGASDGKVYLVDQTGRCLVWDWESQEFRERTFTAQPAGFRWNETSRELVARVGAGYLTVESDATAEVDWVLEPKTIAPGRLGRIPGHLQLDHDGSVLLNLYADDVLFATWAIVERQRMRLRMPQGRASRWRAVLSGTAAVAGFRLHALTWGKP